jgi:hypothetical protein
LGLLLLEQNVDTFHPQADAPRTVETIKQVLQSFDKLDVVKAFWHRLLIDDLVPDVKTRYAGGMLEPKYPTLMTSPSQDLEKKHVDSWLETCSTLEQLPSNSLWKFLPTKEQLQSIRVIFEQKIEVMEPTNELKPQLQEMVTKLHGEGKVDLEEVKSLLLEVAPSRLSEFLSLSFCQKEFYSLYFVPFYEAAKRRNAFAQPNTLPQNRGFWTNACQQLFGKSIQVTRGTRGVRKFHFPSLCEVRKNFARRILGKQNIYLTLYELGEIEF